MNPEPSVLFETDRLTVRRLVPSDAEAMFAIYGDPETVRYVADSKPLTYDMCLNWVDVTDQNFKRRGYGMVAFVDRESGQIVGCGGMVHPDQQEEAELKYALRRDQWGKGLATEAASALLSYGRANWGITRVIATVFPDNLRSQRILSKCGFAKNADRINDDLTITQVWESTYQQ